MRQAGLTWDKLPDYLGFVLELGVKAVQVQVQS